MKKCIFAIIFIISSLAFVYGGANSDLALVNSREYGPDQIHSISVRYNSGRVNIFRAGNESIVVREYMNYSDSDFFAQISEVNGNLTIEEGNRQFMLIKNLRRRIEIFIPAVENLSITTSSGSIRANGKITASFVDLESSSGSITINKIEAERVNLKTSSGSIQGDEITGEATIGSGSGRITFGAINGNAQASSSSGSMDLGLVSGDIKAKTLSGSIHSELTENAGDIALTSSSGSVTLKIPKSLHFNYSSRTSSGRLSTPFSDRLFSPISDRKLVQGVIGDGEIPESQKQRNVNITTSSGSINIHWAK